METSLEVELPLPTVMELLSSKDSLYLDIAALERAETLCELISTQGKENITYFEITALQNPRVEHVFENPFHLGDAAIKKH